MAAVRRLALTAHGVGPEDIGEAPGATQKAPRVVFVKRYKKKREENPRGGGEHYNRVLGDPEQLVAAFASEGIQVEECCDFAEMKIKDMLEIVSKAQVLISLHGAGLINGIFARKGVVLVELHGGYGADDVIFRRLAQGRRGGYMKVKLDEKLDSHDLGPGGRATAVARCAVKLFEGQQCEKHPDIEESWTAREMWPPELQGEGQ